MPRPCKAVVDYFPHYIGNGKTIFNLEAEFGNDGYAFWFKLLELLGDTENHFYDCNKPKHWRYLLSKTRFKEEDAVKILSLLVELEAIDEELWEHKIIWSANFVENLAALYSRREVSPYTKDDIKGFCVHKQPVKRDNDSINPQSIVKESKGKKSTEKNKLAEFVLMTEEQHQKLIDEYGEEATKRMIEILDNYKGAKGKKYKDDYRAIKNWVVDRYYEEQAKAPSGKPKRSEPPLDLEAKKRIEELNRQLAGKRDLNNAIEGGGS